MTANTEHTRPVVLLRFACISLLIGLVLAWCLVFTGGLAKMQFFVDIFVERKLLLSSHLDFLMMTMLLLGFYASGVSLPGHVCWPMAIGSITNPTCFLIAALGVWNTAILVFTVVSISLTTCGYGMASIKVFRSTLKR